MLRVVTEILRATGILPTTNQTANGMGQSNSAVDFMLSDAWPRQRRQGSRKAQAANDECLFRIDFDGPSC